MEITNYSSILNRTCSFDLCWTGNFCFPPDKKPESTFIQWPMLLSTSSCQSQTAAGLSVLSWLLPSIMSGIFFLSREHCGLYMMPALFFLDVVTASYPRDCFVSIKIRSAFIKVCFWKYYHAHCISIGLTILTPRFYLASVTKQHSVNKFAWQLLILMILCQDQTRLAASSLFSVAPG